ncbi:uncharacterized protein J7T54_003567 [Emericellopsis cladophorae]|uniref:Rhodopsin domain-containing protein n=1 Tax=Emericellopsis cladophorae TaxID=2686198 RepID=A0A9Q0BF61_9HYPO|nr:uncharacterized protein J7T54_003567 [Emericellopsis cladophorae]KAI6782556.1 hypothetical protein J7T54_003567 [Emericellopsis cladophorae]
MYSTTGLELTATNTIPMAAFVRIINIYRLLYLNERAKHYNIAYVWTPVECDVAKMACCMPALRPLFSRLWPRSFDNSGAKAEEYPYSNSLGNVTYGRPSMGGSHQPRDRSGATKGFMLKDIYGSRKKTQT